jgi:hypothetical protein
MAFDKSAFEQAFGASLIVLAGSEKVTKAELQVLSRTVLEAWHITGDVCYANKLIRVLTPVNKKVAVAFFIHFSGFSFDSNLMEFTKKSKKRYEEAHKLAMQLLEDPNQNIWTWADRHIDIVKKEFSLADVTATTKRFIDKAQKANIKQVDLLRAILAGGLTMETLLEAMSDQYHVKVTEAPQTGADGAVDVAIKAEGAAQVGDALM